MDLPSTLPKSCSTRSKNVDDLNPSNLAAYDLLFFLNSTLRVDSPTEDALVAETPSFEPGNWRNFEAAIDIGTRDLEGRIALSQDGAQDGAELSGMADFGTAAPIDAISRSGNDLTLSWVAGGGTGRVTANVTLTDEGFSGELTTADGRMPIKGENADFSSDPEPAAPTDPITAAHRNAILEFAGNGGGIVAAHAGLDALYGWGEYRRMMGGGLFESHPWTEEVRITIEDPDNPAVAHLGDALTIRDEIYMLDANPRWNSHVLAALDTGSVGIEQGPADGSRNDFPISWIREHNGVKVFVTKLGHFPEVWTNPAFVQHLLQGMRMTAGRIPANFGSQRVKEVIADNVWPDDIAIDEKGNVWIAELRGKIHRYDAASGETAQIAHLTTTDPTKIEHGLMGIEVDPEFYDGSPYVYLYYTERETFINTLARFPWTEGRLDLDGGEVILRVPTEPQCCHQAGDLEWGLDGTLYLSTGDTGMSETNPAWELSEAEIDAYKARNGLKDHHWSRLVDSERSAQNLQDLRGKIVRINKDGTVPNDNPFYGEAGVRWEIYAYGLRNPYRFKVHPSTGDLYIGVVGPDARYDYDEYDVSANGGENFGWPRSIGRLFYNDWTPDDIPNYVPPLWEYTYATGGRSATMGPVYDHQGPGAFPDVFQGKVFIYDWARRWIKWADIADGTFTNDVDADVRETPLTIEQPARRFKNIRDFDQLTSTAPISMELGPDGSLYVAEFDGFWDAGPNAKVTRYRWVTGSEASQELANATAVGAATDDPGAAVYNARCASCHQASGQGVSGVFPPLAGTDWVTGDKSRLIGIILNGLSGEIDVDGVTYNGAMPPWSATLTDREIAAVLTHVRTSFGNDAEPVSAAEVAAIRSN
jgi:glucose/arabinose dehydrogenase/cytochrome c5